MKKTSSATYSRISSKKQTVGKKEDNQVRMVPPSQLPVPSWLQTSLEVMGNDKRKAKSSQGSPQEMQLSPVFRAQAAWHPAGWLCSCCHHSARTAHCSCWYPQFIGMRTANTCLWLPQLVMATCSYFRLK